MKKIKIKKTLKNRNNLLIKRIYEKIVNLVMNYENILY